LLRLQFFTSGELTPVANSIHNLSTAVLVAYSAKSFQATADATRQGQGSLPFLMMAITRLSVVVSQLSTMALATTFITIISASVQWPWLALFASAAIALGMLFRMASSMFLMLHFSDRGSMVSVVTSIQTSAKSVSRFDSPADFSSSLTPCSLHESSPAA
jgi:hypothetical protein